MWSVSTSGWATRWAPCAASPDTIRSTPSRTNGSRAAATTSVRCAITGCTLSTTHSRSTTSLWIVSRGPIDETLPPPSTSATRPGGGVRHADAIVPGRSSMPSPRSIRTSPVSPMYEARSTRPDGMTRAVTCPSARRATGPGIRGSPWAAMSASASRWWRMLRSTTYGPAMASSAASRPAGSTPSWIEPSSVQRSMSGCGRAERLVEQVADAGRVGPRPAIGGGPELRDGGVARVERRRGGDRQPGRVGVRARGQREGGSRRGDGHRATIMRRSPPGPRGRATPGCRAWRGTGRGRWGRSPCSPRARTRSTGASGCRAACPTSWRTSAGPGVPGSTMSLRNRSIAPAWVRTWANASASPDASSTV